MQFTKPIYVGHTPDEVVAAQLTSHLDFYIKKSGLAIGVEPHADLAQSVTVTLSCADVDDLMAAVFYFGHLHGENELWK